VVNGKRNREGVKRIALRKERIADGVLHVIGVGLGLVRCDLRSRAISHMPHALFFRRETDDDRQPTL
jgi:hypothetical protein